MLYKLFLLSINKYFVHCNERKREAKNKVCWIINRRILHKITDMRMWELAKANGGSGNEKNVIASCFSAKREADTFVMDGRRPLKLQLLLPLPSVRSLQLLLAAGNAEPTPVSGNPSKIILSVIPYRSEITKRPVVNKLTLFFNQSTVKSSSLILSLFMLSLIYIMENVYIVKYLCIIIFKFRSNLCIFKHLIVWTWSYFLI